LRRDAEGSHASQVHISEQAYSAGKVSAAWEVEQSMEALRGEEEKVRVLEAERNSNLEEISDCYKRLALLEVDEATQFNRNSNAI